MIMINFNMGCIETRQNGGTTATKPRLTLTWDVLKQARIKLSCIFTLLLTLTWDVLKLVHTRMCYFVH